MEKLLSLRGKMLMFTFGVVAVLTGLSLGVVHSFVAGRVENQVGADLERTHSVFFALMRERARGLRSQCEVVAQDPRFIATLDIEIPQLEYQAKTVLREARQFQSVIGCDIFMVVGATGIVLTRLEISNSALVDLSELSSLDSALKGEPSTGNWRKGERDFQVATVPIFQDNVLTGTLTVGFAGSGDLKWVLDGLMFATQDELIQRPVAAEEPGDVAALMREILDQIDSDLVIITNENGTPFGMVERTTGYGENASGIEQIQEALSGKVTSGLRADGSRIVQMVVVPVLGSRGEIVGALGTGFGVDDLLAKELREMMHSEISFSLGSRLVSSTWSEDQRRDIERQVFTGDRDEAAEHSPFEVNVGEETFLSLLGKLDDMRGAEGGFYLIQLSLDEAIAFLTTVEQVLLFIGGGVLFAAALISFAGVSQITRPVNALVAGTRRLASGELGHRIPPSSRDEIGELAGSFNDMAEALSTSHNALEESARLYRDLFDNAQDIVYTTDMSMKSTSVNKAAIEYTGYSAQELIGKSFYDLLAQEDADRLMNLDDQILPGAPRIAVEVEVLRKDGQHASVEIVSRWIEEAGQTVGLHGIGRDITERKEREEATQRFREQLHQAEKLRALGEMAAGVAHNFNNLLTGVMGYAELMKMRDDVPEPVLANAEKIVQSARRCSAIVKRIQSFGRPSDPSQLSQVNLHQVVRDTIDITHVKWKAQAEQEGKIIDIDLTLDEVAPVQSAGSAWEEILSNLIFNGVDAMPEGGRITISTKMDGDEVCLSVSDTGTGMDEETRRRVFEPFFTTKAPDKGTGLGLSTVWGIIQGQGGRIEIESEPGKGTTFHIRVPVVSDEPVPAEFTAGLDAVTGLRILVIDDDPAIRDFLPSLLVSHEVDCAQNGVEGMTLFREKLHDLVITDWVMAGISGLEVADRVKALSPQTVLVLMTGWEYRGSPVDESKSVDLIVSKPFDAEKLDDTLRQAFKEAAFPDARRT